MPLHLIRVAGSDQTSSVVGRYPKPLVVTSVLGTRDGKAHRAPKPHRGTEGNPPRPFQCAGRSPSPCWSPPAAAAGTRPCDSHRSRQTLRQPPSPTGAATPRSPEKPLLTLRIIFKFSLQNSATSQAKRLLKINACARLSPARKRSPRHRGPCSPPHMAHRAARCQPSLAARGWPRAGRTRESRGRASTRAGGPPLDAAVGHSRLGCVAGTGLSGEIKWDTHAHRHSTYQHHTGTQTNTSI